MSESGVRVTTDEATMRIRIERPERGNSLRPQDIAELLDALHAAATSDTLRVVVLEAEGKNFCTGAELGQGGSSAGSDTAPPRTGAMVRRLDAGAHRVAPAVWNHPLPVVAAVQGHAAGLGCQLALSADFVVARAGAQFSTPFVKRGFSPDSTSTYLLPRIVGVPLARRMLLLGETVPAETLAARDVVELAAEDEFDERVEAMIAALASAPTVAVGLAKRALRTNLDGDIERAAELESLAVELSLRSPDFKEGIRAFGERRPPEFTGR